MLSKYLREILKKKFVSNDFKWSNLERKEKRIDNFGVLGSSATNYKQIHVHPIQVAGMPNISLQATIESRHK